MRTIIISIFIVFVSQLYAQELQVELGYSYNLGRGYGYQGNRIIVFDEAHGLNLRLDGAHYNFLSSSGNMHFKINRKFNKHRLGLGINYERQVFNRYFGLDLKKLVSESIYNFYRLGLAYDFQWLTFNKLHISSGLAYRVGVRNVNSLFFSVNTLKENNDDPVLNSFENFHRAKEQKFINNLFLNLVEIGFGIDRGVSFSVSYDALRELDRGDIFLGVKVYTKI